MKNLVSELINTAQDLVVDITVDTGKTEEERQQDMESATYRILEIAKKLDRLI